MASEALARLNKLLFQQLDTRLFMEINQNKQSLIPNSLRHLDQTNVLNHFQNNHLGALSSRVWLYNILRFCPGWACGKIGLDTIQTSYFTISRDSAA